MVDAPGFFTPLLVRNRQVFQSAVSAFHGPQWEKHGSVWVCRDDLLPGGTKSRFLPALIAGAKEVVYCGWPESGAALALAYSAWRLYGGSGCKVTLLYPGRPELTARQREAKRLGARIWPIRKGTLANLRATAEDYCASSGARLIEWGLTGIEDSIAAWASGFEFPAGEELWLAAGSGTLMRGLAKAFPELAVVGVQVGREVTDYPENCRLVRHPLRYEQETAVLPPFPACRTFEAKAWDFLQREERRNPGPVRLFWNVMRNHL